MSKLTELLDELCPYGVARARFSDVCDYVRGVTYKKDQEVTSCALGGIKLLRANNITMGSNTLNFDDVKIVSPDVKVSEKQKLSAGDILICAGSGSREHVGKVAFIEEAMPYTFGGFMAVIRTSDNLHSRYFYHVLSSGLFKSYLQTALTSTTINNLSARIMANFTFPLPPLEVQQEIVRVLDAFTDLEQNLAAELELRKKQFGEYRKLAFQITDGIELRTLGEVSRQVISGATPKAGNKAYYEGGSIPWLRTSEVNFGEIWETEVKITEKALSETGVKWIPEDCLIVAISGASAGRSAINRIPTTTNQHCCCLDLDPETVDVRYAFHWTASKYSELKSRGRGARGDLNSRIIRDFEIPVPALAAQHEIAAELNAFESLIQSIEQEISLRRKQYEFYRDELLTFTPKGA